MFFAMPRRPAPCAFDDLCKLHNGPPENSKGVMNTFRCALNSARETALGIFAVVSFMTVRL